jgi:hypothetical protein
MPHMKKYTGTLEQVSRAISADPPEISPPTQPLFVQKRIHQLSSSWSLVSLGRLCAGSCQPPEMPWWSGTS